MLKNKRALVQMHFISGNSDVARDSLACGPDGMGPLIIAQRMLLKQEHLESLTRKMEMEAEHSILLALPCGRDLMDAQQQANNLDQFIIAYLESRQAAGVVGIAAPGHPEVKFITISRRQQSNNNL